MRFIADSLHIGKGSKVLDMGCGWGAFLRYAGGRGAVARGLTLSQGQAAACRANGLTVDLKDCRKVTSADFGTFDAVSSVGAMEHFCSVEQYLAGGQDAVYAIFLPTLPACCRPAAGPSSRRWFSGKT